MGSAAGIYTAMAQTHAATLSESLYPDISQPTETGLKWTISHGVHNAQERHYRLRPSKANPYMRGRRIDPVRCTAFKARKVRLTKELAFSLSLPPVVAADV